MPELLGYQFDRTYALPIERYRQVATTAERDAIPTGKRWHGMLCYVTSDQADYQLIGGITNLDWKVAGVGNYFDLTGNDSDDITEGVVNLFLSTTDQTKLNFITITQTVDLDALEAAVAALGSGVNFIDGWDASVGTFPGGGTAAVGDLYVTTTAGTVDGVSFALGDGVIAIVLNASTTTYAGNWIKTESNSDVTSVVGLTGAISKSALLAALNVEDGATADMTGSEISTAITTFLGNSDWQLQLTTEQVQDIMGGLIAAGVQTNIAVTYNDGSGSIDFTVAPFIEIYATLAALISGQGSQDDDKLYEVTDASGFTGITSGTAWVRYLGTVLGTEADYIIVSASETAAVPAPIPLAPYANLAALVAGQANQLTNYIYEVTDGSGFTGVTSGAVWVKYLGTTVGDETDYTIISKAEVGTGSGDVVGPAVVVDEDIAVFDGTTGKLIKKLAGVTSANVIANNAKVTNATHTGEITGATALTLDVTAISNRTLVTATGADTVVILDATDGSIKKALISDFASAGGTVTSVAQTVPTGLTVSGSPITTSGTLAIAYDTGYQGYTTTEATKLSGIEALADVTDATNVDAAGAVMESDYDANTILAATTDDTPIPLTVAEQTLVGRITGGAIAALTQSQAHTLLNDRILENATVTTTQTLDYAAYEIFNFTMTGDTTFSESNLPISGSYGKVIIINMTGNFAPTYPAGWSTNIIGVYDGTVNNTIVVWYVKSGVYKVQITQPD